MKVSIERLIDFVVEWYVNKEDYCRTSHLPYSHWVHKGSTDGFDKRRDELRSKSSWEMNAWNDVYAAMEILSLDSDERERVWQAGRACYRWYKKTNWEHCLSSEMLEKISNYIFD